MSTGTYFSLKDALSFGSKGPSGKNYVFYKDRATLVLDPRDITVLKTKSELFECDKDGKPILPDILNIKKQPLSVSKFRRATSNKNIEVDMNSLQPQETVLDAFRDIQKKEEEEKMNDPEVQKRLQQIQNGELTEAQRLAMGLDDESLDENIDQEDAEENIEEASKKKKKKKSSSSEKFKCEKCGKKCKSQKEFDEHMELHEEDE